jgi:hypothetical protein
VFKGIDEEATAALATALELEKNLEPADIPSPDAIDHDDFLWEELYETAREDVRNGPNVTDSSSYRRSGRERLKTFIFRRTGRVLSHTKRIIARAQ